MLSIKMLWLILLNHQFYPMNQNASWMLMSYALNIMFDVKY